MALIPSLARTRQPLRTPVFIRYSEQVYQEQKWWPEGINVAEQGPDDSRLRQTSGTRVEYLTLTAVASMSASVNTSHNIWQLHRVVLIFVVVVFLHLFSPSPRLFKQRAWPLQPSGPYFVSCRHVACALCVASCVFVFLNYQSFVGLTALLAAFPPCLGTEEPPFQQTQPLLSGSVCRVRDSLDFLDVSAMLVEVEWYT